VEDEADSQEGGAVSVCATDCPRVGRDYRVRSGDTPDSRWLVNGESTVLLNDSAAEIISRCDGRHSVGRLIEELNEVYLGASEQEIAEGVQAFLELALKKGWIVIELH
jgi:pyrroloquinoline quinone biosynthesis protein D